MPPLHRWNLLDQMQSTHVELSKRANPYFAPGHMREVQLRRMVQLARSPEVTQYCEVGMNVGHSAVAMLLANPQLTVDTFDLMRFNYSMPVVNLMQRGFGSRFRYHVGDSS